MLEDRLRGHPLISQVVVVGDQRPFIGALVTLDADAVSGWLATHGLPEMTVEQASTDPRVRAALDRAVERTNTAVSRAESIRKYAVLPTDFTIDNDLLTPSLKVKRAKVIAAFADEIEALYADTRQPTAG
jgi:long-chain acyl-CoA synthetase